MQVGCVLCGVVHRCTAPRNIVPCQREIQSDTSVVCTLTGIVLSETSFFDSECSTNSFRINSIQDTHRAEPQQAPQSSVTECMSVIRQTGMDMIKLLIYSKHAELCRKKEMQRNEKRVQLSFSQFVTKKRQHNESFTILDAVECAIHADSCIHRRDFADIPPVESWDGLLDHLCFCLSHLGLPKQYTPSIKNENFKHLVICFLYMTKIGLNVHGMNIIPKYEVMQKILPLEVLMWACFKIQSKIITEGENAIKRCVADMTQEQILRFGQSFPLSQKDTAGAHAGLKRKFAGEGSD